MPRKANNIENLIADGKTHISKAEIEKRQENQLEIGTDKIMIPDFVLQEPEAISLWELLQNQLIEKKLLNNFTAPTFAILCDSWAKYIKASIDVRENGITKVIKTKNGENEIQNPAVLVMTKFSDQIKKYAVEFYLTPAAIASYAKNNKPEKEIDLFEKEFGG
jgi:P27 family predicted phage terminase small subunit